MSLALQMQQCSFSSLPFATPFQLYARLNVRTSFLLPLLSIHHHHIAHIALLGCGNFFMIYVAEVRNSIFACCTSILSIYRQLDIIQMTRLYYGIQRMQSITIAGAFDFNPRCLQSYFSCKLDIFGAHILTSLLSCLLSDAPFFQSLNSSATHVQESIFAR